MAGVDGHHYTDLGNAERLIAAHGNTCGTSPCGAVARVRRRPVATRPRRHPRRPPRRRDRTATLLRHIEQVIGDTKATNELIRWARRCESAAGIAATLTVAASRPGVAIDHEALDADPWLLNVRNGTIDLRTGQLRPHDPADLLTMQAAVDYDPDADGTRVGPASSSQILPDAEVAGSCNASPASPCSATNPSTSC